MWSECLYNTKVDPLGAFAEVSELADEQDSGSCVGFHV